MKLMNSTTWPVVITDERLASLVGASDAVTWMRDAVVAAEWGRLTAPPRVGAELGDGRLVFTAGAIAHDWFGYRSYDTFDVEPGEQIVVVHDANTGRVRAIAVGNALGRLRTGALGGVAVDLLSRPGARSIGVVGSGQQAWSQLWAICAVRPVEQVTVYSPTTAHSEAFAACVRDELGVRCSPASTAEAAVRGQDVVVLATNSPTSVIDAGWLAAGTHVTTLGPKQQGAAEFGLDLFDAADVVVTDSPAQLHAYDPPSLVVASRRAEGVRSLGAVASAAAPGRRGPDQITVYLSVGLAGTEVHLLACAASRATADG
jgi:ornithine cyclodeaminase